MNSLTLKTKNTWCPGCGNFGIFESLKRSVLMLEKDGLKRENIVLVSGVGCHAKISDYISVNSFYGLHGRSLPLAQGIKLGNEKLSVLCSTGDGDCYNEGISHLIHAAKRNSDITVIVHNNRTFALTVKQFTSTSPKGFKGSSTPLGSTEKPINPLRLVLNSGATFVARGYSGEIDHLKELIFKGVKHKGFSFIEVLQPCVAWFNVTDIYKKNIYKIDDLSRKKAISLVDEWDYNNDNSKIPIGLFYQEESNEIISKEMRKKVNLKKIIKNHE